MLQVLQKILSLLTTGQEKKVCKYQSTVFSNASNQLHLNPSSATVGKTPHNTRPQSGQNTDCLQEDKKNGEPQNSFKYNNLPKPQQWTQFRIYKITDTDSQQC